MKNEQKQSKNWWLSHIFVQKYFLFLSTGFCYDNLRCTFWVCGRLLSRHAIECQTIIQNSNNNRDWKDSKIIAITWKKNIYAQQWEQQKCTVFYMYYIWIWTYISCLMFSILLCSMKDTFSYRCIFSLFAISKSIGMPLILPHHSPCHSSVFAVTM